MTSPLHFKTLCFGEILWDIFHDNSGSRKVLGGAPSNLCYFLNALEEPAILISQVGNDELGNEALRALQSLNIPHIIPKTDIPTGRVDIQIEDNEPRYTFNDPAAWDMIPYTQAMENVAKKVDMIAFGSLAHRSVNQQDQDIAINSDSGNDDNRDAHCDSSFETLKQLLAANPNAIRFLDLNLRHPHYHESRLQTLLAFADILKINEDEFNYLKKLLNLTAQTTRDALFSMIQLLSLNFIILTLGQNGSIVMSEHDYSAKSALKTDIINTVGAGDSFSAGFLSALSRGASFTKAHDFANQLSGYICTQEGAFVEIPQRFKTMLAQLSHW